MRFGAHYALVHVRHVKEMLKPVFKGLYHAFKAQTELGTLQILRMLLQQGIQAALDLKKAQ